MKPTTPPPTELPLVPKLDSYSGRKIAATSLRPGDWFQYRGFDTSRSCVLQNWASLSRIERWDGFFRRADTIEYSFLDSSSVIGNGLIYIGQGVRRWWWKWLPKTLQKYVCPFSGPRRK